jgi:hypothetical protein
MLAPWQVFECSVGGKVEVANSQNRERSSLNISRQTKDDLDSIKHSGQSYDGLIQELIKFWKDKGREKKNRAEESDHMVGVKSQP